MQKHLYWQLKFNKKNRNDGFTPVTNETFPLVHRKSHKDNVRSWKIALNKKKPQNVTYLHRKSFSLNESMDILIPLIETFP